MIEKHSPTDVGVVKEKLEKGEVKVKGYRTKRNTAQKSTSKEHSVKGVNGKISDAKIVAWLKEQDGAVTSTQVRDGLGFKSRTQARRVLRRLAKAKKVIISQHKLTEKRQVFTFMVA